jgi:flagellar protein FlgJ
MIKPVAPKTPQPAINPDLRKAAQGFEAVFLRQVIGSMRQAKLADDIMGSSATDTYRELADRQLADGMAARGSMGIAAMVEAQFAKKDQAK